MQIDYRNGDFHRLNSGEVEQVIADANAEKYRKPKNANGSRARYFFYREQRRIARERREYEGR